MSTAQQRAASLYIVSLDTPYSWLEASLKHIRLSSMPCVTTGLSLLLKLL